MAQTSPKILGREAFKTIVSRAITAADTNATTELFEIPAGAWVPPFGARGAAVARWVGFLVGCLPIVSIVAADLSSGRPWSLLLPAAPALLYAPSYVAVPAAAALVGALLWTDWLSAPMPQTTRSPSGHG